MTSWQQGRQAIWVGTLAIAGCSEVEPLATPTEQRLRALATAYLDYAAARGSGPTDEQELTRHLRTMPAFALGLNDLSADSLARLYLSPRDEKPFAIHYGKAICFSENAVQQVIAHEAVGAEGTRFVAYANGEINSIATPINNSAVFSSAKGF